MAGDSDQGTLGALEALNASLRALMEQVRRSRAPRAVLEQARGAVDTATAQLAPHARGAPFAQIGWPHEVEAFVRGAEDPVAFFPYSPVIGRLNPLAPPIDFEVRDGVVHAETTLGALYTGPPGAVHGGIIALVFDELLGSVNLVHQLGAFTGTLSVKYLAPTPIGERLHMEGHQDGSEGRKTFASGRLWCGDRLTAEAQGVFIQPDKETGDRARALLVGSQAGRG